MWKTTSLSILVLLLAVDSNVQAIQSPRPLVVPSTNENGPKKNDALKLRGGDLGPVTGTTLAQVLSGLAGLDAICGTLFPRTSMRWMGVPVAQDALSVKYLHGMGASGATIAVSLWFAVTETPVAEALGYGLAARLAIMTFMIVSDQERQVGMKFTMFGAMWLFLAGTVYALLTSTGEPLMLAKIISVVLAIHGLFLHLKPEVFLRKTAVAVGPDPFVKEMLSIDGGYMFASAVATGLLAQGVDAVTTAGYTCLSLLPVFLKVMEVMDTETSLGIPTPVATTVLTIVLATLIVGTLLH